MRAFFCPKVFPFSLINKARLVLKAYKPLYQQFMSNSGCGKKHFIVDYYLSKELPNTNIKKRENTNSKTHENLFNKIALFLLI